jgi:hypothetical protein
MLAIDNETLFQADRALLLDSLGGHVWTLAIKGTFQIDERGVAELASDQEPIAVAPVWSGTPGESSLLRESELVLEHPGTDVTVTNAFAYAPSGQALQVEVGLAVGALLKVLCAIGERIWSSGLVGLAMTKPRPFERIPISWERAYGGTVILDPSAGTSASEPRNPVGRGFAVDPRRLEGKPLPNLEDLRLRISSWRDRPAPAGLGPIASSWAPRRDRAGTYDERWQRTRMPLWPEDYDPRFHVSAPEGLHAERCLRGGEAVRIVGLTREGELAFRLPREHVCVETQLGRDVVRQPVQLERVILEPETRRVLVVWGSRLPCGSRGREVVASRVFTKKWVHA